VDRNALRKPPLAILPNVSTHFWTETQVYKPKAMKKITTFIIIAILLSSCIDIRFESSQPIDFIKFKEVPDELVGKYIPEVELSGKSRKFLEKELKKEQKKSNSNNSTLSSRDSLIITKTGFRTLLSDFRKELSDSVVLKRMNDSTYVISIAKKDTIQETVTWHVHPLTIRENKLTIYDIQSNESFKDSTLQELEKIVDVKKVCRELEGRKRKSKKDIVYDKHKNCYYVINPSVEDLKKLLDKGIFREWIVYNKVK
jgi:hypothetical protein